MKNQYVGHGFTHGQLALLIIVLLCIIVSLVGCATTQPQVRKHPAIELAESGEDLQYPGEEWIDATLPKDQGTYHFLIRCYAKWIRELMPTVPQEKIEHARMLIDQDCKTDAEKLYEKKRFALVEDSGCFYSCIRERANYGGCHETCDVLLRGK